MTEHARKRFQVSLLTGLLAVGMVMGTGVALAQNEERKTKQTVAMSQQVCAEAGVTFVVLDRPNPIGAAIGGSVRDADAESFVAFHPVPLRHGMTAGEMALAFHRERGLRGRLAVVPVPLKSQLSAPAGRILP